MRLDSLRLRAISTAFPDEVHVDLRALSGLCSVVGPNGAGKSTLLGAFAAALDRKMPDGQPLTALATARDSYVEASYVNGQAFTVRQTIDAVSGKGEAIVIDADNNPLDDGSGKVSAVKRWVAEHLPSPEVRYASIWSAQGEYGFIALDPAWRKSVVMKALGHDHLEQKAARARAKATDERDALNTCIARLSDERARGGDVEALANDLEAAQKALACSEAEVASATKLLEEARKEAEQRRTEEQAERAAIDKRTALDKQITGLNAELGALQERRRASAEVMAQADEIRKACDAATAAESAASEAVAIAQARAERRRAEEQARQVAADKRGELAHRMGELALEQDDIAERRRNNAELVEQAAEIRRAAAEVARLDAEIARLEAEHQRLDQARDIAERDVEAKRRDVDARTREAREATRRAEQLQRRMLELQPIVERAEAALPRTQEAVAEAETAEEQHRKDLDVARQRQLHGKDDRITSLRFALGAIRDCGPDPRHPTLIAESSLANDDEVETTLAALPTRIAELTASASGAGAAVNTLRAALTGVQRDAERRPELDQLIADLEAGRTAETAANKAVDAAEADLAAAEIAVGTAADAAKAATAASLPLRTERTQHLRLAARAEQLAKAEARIEELDAQATKVTEQLAKVQAEHAAIVVPEVATPPVDVRAAEITLEHAAEARLRASQRVDALAQAEARVEELDAQQRRVTARLEQLHREASAIVVPAVTTPSARVEAAERDVEEARSRLETDRTAHTRAADALERAQTSATRIAELEAERKRREDDLSDWRLLEKSLGRDGLQALELDAAAPELTELCNDLLHRCLGTRWSVRFETAVAKKSGKGEREGCWVMVHDAQTGKERDAKHHSGGEKALIGEAVNLAITMLGCRHAGLTEPTLIRDESSAALDPEHGPAYVAMLRRAAEVVGSPLVLYVSHTPALQELADSRLVVGNGRVEVQA